MASTASRSTDRLTEKEKECLRLWLAPATAKEIALELGVSHHAIEKRLKTARAKLDVSTSRDAARMLAETEQSQGYQQTASDLPDLAVSDMAQHASEHVATRWGIAGFLRHPFTIPGGLVMSIILATLALAATGPIIGQAGIGDIKSADRMQEHDATIQGNGRMGPQSVTPDYRTVYVRSGGDSEQTVRRTFSVLDGDDSGVIDPSEIQSARFVVVQRNASGQGDPDMEPLADGDSDSDGRITPSEYSAWLTPMIDAAGGAN